MGEFGKAKKDLDQVSLEEGGLIKGPEMQKLTKIIEEGVKKCEEAGSAIPGGEEKKCKKAESTIKGREMPETTDDAIGSGDHEIKRWQVR